MSDSDALEALIRARLYPLQAYDPVTRKVRSDHEMSPEGWPKPTGPLQPAAVLIPLVERDEGLTILLTRRAEGMRRHSGQIAFPGGRADPGEAPWDTALRETREEIGLDPGFVRLAGLTDPYETVTGFSITPVVGLVRPGFELTLQAAEVAEVFETPFAYAMDPSNHERRSRDFGDGLNRQFFAIEHGERVIWGATAGMLRMLYERLFGEEPQ
ncbi:MAG: coenzyme A pyrophosphatase [Caulobacterales bacterium 32-69-10]|nr:MAG: coenzyme A pyrophosphatase [Caulobacterales bacterium 32-69-10]